MEAKELKDHINECIFIPQLGWIKIEKVGIYSDVIHVWTHFTGYQQEQLIKIEVSEYIVLWNEKRRGEEE